MKLTTTVLAVCNVLATHPLGFKQAQVLAFVLDCAASRVPCYSSDLRRVFGLTRSAINLNLVHLHRKGYIHTARVTRNKRSCNLISPSAAAADMMKMIHQHRQEINSPATPSKPALS